MKPVKGFGGKVVSDIDIVPNTAHKNAVPGMLGGTVGAAIAVNDIARDVLASSDGGKEAGDIVADALFRLQGFVDVRELVRKS